MKALDKTGLVIYLGSFSKTLFPGLRLGYLVADQATPPGPTLAAELSKVKSLITVNTSPLLQAVVGGVLLDSGGSLVPIVHPKLEHYRKKRDLMLSRLEEEFSEERSTGVVRWNQPAGGFFISMTLPFEFDTDCLTECASSFGVIVCPMTFFALSPGRECQIRLSFSYVDSVQITEGVQRLKAFVRSHQLDTVKAAK